MKQLIFTSGMLLFSFFVFGQSAEFQAPSEGSAQIFLRSNSNSEIFKLQMNNDGQLRVIANVSDEVMVINDENGNITISGEVNTPAGSSNMIAKAYGSYTDIAGSGMINQSSNVVSMTKITSGADRVRIRFNGNYASSLAITATPIQHDISSGYFCTVDYFDADEIDVYVHLLNGADAGDQSFSFVAFARD
jgi:hypothetical protein